ncbi:MAG: 50S ribosomal protein L29 [Candidatus Marsarchaeota archaeon]|nr:50S ribosomal protein L29 [Candidatus Marsarchaeota archaeon]
MFYIKLKELRALPDATLKGKLNELTLELAIEKRKIASTGVASKVVKTRDIKRTRARILTILNERGAKI